MAYGWSKWILSISQTADTYINMLIVVTFFSNEGICWPTITSSKKTWSFIILLLSRCGNHRDPVFGKQLSILIGVRKFRGDKQQLSAFSILLFHIDYLAFYGHAIVHIDRLEEFKFITPAHPPQVPDIGNVGHADESRQTVFPQFPDRFFGAGHANRPGNVVEGRSQAAVFALLCRVFIEVDRVEIVDGECITSNIPGQHRLSGMHFALRAYVLCPSKTFQKRLFHNSPAFEVFRSQFHTRFTPIWNQEVFRRRSVFRRAEWSQGAHCARCPDSTGICRETSS